MLLNTLCMLCPAVLDGAERIMPGGCPEWLDWEQAQEIEPADARDDDNETVLGVCLGIALLLCIICLLSCPALLIKPPQNPHPPLPSASQIHPHFVCMPAHPTFLYLACFPCSASSYSLNGLCPPLPPTLSPSPPPSLPPLQSPEMWTARLFLKSVWVVSAHPCAVSIPRLPLSHLSIVCSLLHP